MGGETVERPLAGAGHDDDLSLVCLLSRRGRLSLRECIAWRRVGSGARQRRGDGARLSGVWGLKCGVVVWGKGAVRSPK